MFNIDEEKDVTVTSIFDGVNALVRDALSLDDRQNLKQKSTCLELTSKVLDNGALAQLVVNLQEQIYSNWTGRLPSKENWRKTRVTTLAEINKSPEVVLERAIAILGDQGVLPQWYNQIPVASGMINGRANKRAAVDLIRVHGHHVDLVELKWGSDTPAFAAFEILQYGIAYLLCRDNKEAFGYEKKELLNVKNVNLQVLAPQMFYEPYDMAWLGKGIRQGLKQLCEGRCDDLKISFQFISFPSDFELPFSSGLDVMNHFEKSKEEGPNHLIVQALNNLQPIWEVDA